MDREAPPLAVVIDPNLGEAVYAQIARQVRDAVATGRLDVGASLPSVRTMASDLGVNLNTVARAYRALEEEGFVVIENRTGVSVAPPGARGTPEDRRRLTEELADLLGRMRQAGLTPGELRRLTARALATRGQSRR
jgi:GntR family transcriptional regulator